MTESKYTEAVIYCRISTAEQTLIEDRLDAQEARCREFARAKSYAILESFHDDVSGSLVERPGINAMLSFIRRRGAGSTVVIVDDVCSLARDFQVHLTLRKAISDAGGRLASPSHAFGDDPESMLVENLLASVSQHQRGNGK